jgi:hypothetical protein
MKKLAAIICLSALTTGAFAQGLISFANQPGSKITAATGPGGVAADLAAGSPASYYFALLTSAQAGGPFTFAGVYGTNSASAGRLQVGTFAVNGWAPGTAMSYEVFGWSKSLGATFNPAWLTGNALHDPADLNVWTTAGFANVSGIATGTAGGGSPIPAPAWNLFGGSGLTGFNLVAVGTVVPEPTSMALAGLGAAALLIFRRRK